MVPHAGFETVKKRDKARIGFRGHDREEVNTLNWLIKIIQIFSQYS